MPRRGRRRKKTKTHVLPPEESEDARTKIPRTIVVKRGRVGRSVEALVADMRMVMQPNTAMKLKERKRSALKDYVSVAAPLGVSQLLMFTRTEKCVNFRIGRVPRGPTLSFAVKSYILGSDIRRSQKRPVDYAGSLRYAPLVVLNNFDKSKKELALVSLTFQSMFPSINLQTTKLADCQRCVLLNYEKDSGEIEFRHYFIRPRPTGVSRSVKRLVQARIPDLSRLNDISEYVLGNDIHGPGGGAGSDSEFEDEASKVTLAQDLRSRGNRKAGQSAIRLVEIGPRMTLNLTKVESGLAEGDILYHAYVQKTKAEAVASKRKHEEKELLRTARREEQEENVARKKPLVY